MILIQINNLLINNVVQVYLAKKQRSKKAEKRVVI